MTNMPDVVQTISVAEQLVFDHYLVSATLKLVKLGKSKKIVSSRNMRCLNIEDFKASVASVLTGLNCDKCDLAKQYSTQLANLLDKHAPLVQRLITDRSSAPWMSLEIKQAKTERRLAERQWRKFGLTVLKEIYAHLRNVVNRMVRDAKNAFFSSKIETSNSVRELFRVSNHLMGVKSNPVLPSSISIASLPDKFLEFFTSKIELIRQNFTANSLHVEQEPSILVHESFSGTPFISFQQVTCDQVKKTILNMPKKACDLDPIPSSLLFSCLDEVLPVITDIMNESLNTGTVPDCFKHALVTPLLKKSNLNPEQLKNYRPVSNLSFLSKLLERIVLSQLLDHLESNDLLEPFQSAYRKHHSTETALLRVVNDLLQASDKGCVSILSLLDLSAAFDTIDHSILLARLSQYFGCSGTVLNWFKSYLQNRTQCVLINGVKSAKSKPNYGVPQGSVLGPVLFTMYTRPLSSIIAKLNALYHFFADDSQLYPSTQLDNFAATCDDLQTCIESVADWMYGSKLRMNDEKTEAMCIGSKSKCKEITRKSMSVHQSKIIFSSSVKNLGVFLDQSLTMEVHVNHLC